MDQNFSYPHVGQKIILIWEVSLKLVALCQLKKCMHDVIGSMQ